MPYDADEDIREFCVNQIYEEVKAEQTFPLEGTTLQSIATVATSESNQLPPDCPDLTKLSTLDYDRKRTSLAAKLGVSMGALDEERKNQLKKLKSTNDDSELFETIEPADNRVEGATILDEAFQTLLRYVVLPDGTASAVALWSAFTWVHDSFATSPLLIINSPEKRCGKSTLLTLIGEFVQRPLLASNITPAALFRTIEKFSPTLLLDEADAWMKENNELRGLLNSGHGRKNAKVIRTVGDNHEPTVFKTWCPKAIAGIGKFADTLMDRSISVPMRRRKPGETVETLRSYRVDLTEFRRNVCRWSADNAEALKTSEPVIPADLNDRAADNWRPLLAIADLAGGRWPSEARRTAVLLTRDQENDSTGTTILKDMRELFDSKRQEVISSFDICCSLNEFEDRPWGSWNHGNGISPRDLARKLKEYGVNPKQARIGSTNKRGYLINDLQEAFERYI